MRLYQNITRRENRFLIIKEGSEKSIYTNMRDIRNVIKRIMVKILYTKNTYIVKLMLKVIAAGMRHFYGEITFYIHISKKSAGCKLCHALTIPSTAHYS
jgi:hypothetical protein